MIRKVIEYEVPLREDSYEVGKNDKLYVVCSLPRAVLGSPFSYYFVTPCSCCSIAFENVYNLKNV